MEIRTDPKVYRKYLAIRIILAILMDTLDGVLIFFSFRLLKNGNIFLFVVVEIFLFLYMVLSFYSYVYLFIRERNSFYRIENGNIVFFDGNSREGKTVPVRNITEIKEAFRKGRLVKLTLFTGERYVLYLYDSKSLMNTAVMLRKGGFQTWYSR